MILINFENLNETRKLETLNSHILQSILLQVSAIDVSVLNSFAKLLPEYSYQSRILHFTLSFSVPFEYFSRKLDHHIIMRNQSKN